MCIPTCCTSEQLADDDLYRIEPIKSFRFGTTGDALAIVALAVAPETDAVEVVQTDSLGNRVDDSGIGNRLGEDVR
jgi:hypothetical protein